MFTHKWLRIAFLNLFTVSILGVILRYKIAFSFPFIDQKNLLHGHSHFAFSGWITQALMYLLIRQLRHETSDSILKKYKWILFSNLMTAYGMLISFPIEGYGLYSIIFSTLSVFVSYWFAFIYWKDLKRQPASLLSHNWFRAALFFNAFASLGIFSLAFIMAKKIMIQKLSLLSVYFYLHFQYNGWFFFAIFGFLISVIEPLIIKKTILHKVFIAFFASCFPAYFLSALWLPIPYYFLLIIIVSALIQLIGWGIIVNLIRLHRGLFKTMNPLSRSLFMLSALALTLKFLLQLLSTIPSLSQLAFGFRPIVIGYLHLVFLGVITIAIIGYSLINEIKNPSKTFKIGVLIFVFGIIINEVFLMVQGVSDLAYIEVPFINESLFVAALILFTGLLILNIRLSPKKKHLV